jgi:hypothetical protein
MMLIILNNSAFIYHFTLKLFNCQLILSPLLQSLQLLSSLHSKNQQNLSTAEVERWRLWTI